MPLIALFGVGAFAMRGAGCTINDLWDRDIDRQVERTRLRPLASGALSPPQALAFLGAQLSAGLGVLLSLPPPAVALGLASTPLFTLYPLAKRLTDWPQLVLGLTFNWGALMGSTAVHGACDWPVALPLYGAGVCWTLVYDTIYAHQDKADDARVGVRSTALRFGGDSRRWLSAFAVGTVGSLVLVGVAATATATAATASGGGVAPLSLPAYGAGVAGGAAHLAWQLRTVDFDSRADCLRKFQSNHHFGAIIFAALAAGRLLATADEPPAARGEGDGDGERAPGGWRAPGGTMYAWLERNCNFV